MAKKLNVKHVDDLLFELNEDGIKGDQIDLNNLQEIDFSILKKTLSNKENEIIKEYWQSNKNTIINESKEFIELKEKISILDKEISNKDYQKQLEISKLEAKLKEEKNSLENELNNSKNKNEKEIELVKEKEKSIFLNEKLNLKSKISDLENQIKLVEEQKEKLLIQKEYELKDKYQLQIDELNIKLREKQSGLSIKQLGEDLENWIKTQASNNLQFSDILFDKTNETIDGTKPDFKFTILDDNKAEITSVTIEAKSEAINSKSKKRNQDHLEKLDSDRNKNQSEYALLITELETADNFIMKVANGYENMYIVRPHYFIPVLLMIYNVAQKQKEINSLDIELKDKQLIIAEFNEFKTDILSNNIKIINDHTEKIISKADKIIKLAEEQKDSARKIGKNLITIENKIEKFNIQKKLKNN